MSLNNLTTGQIVWKQYRYKLKAYHQVFTSLVVLQLIALVISFLGASTSYGGGGYGLNPSLNVYSGTIILIFTFVWAVMNAFVVTTKAYREDDFLFVTTRVSQHFANGLFLVTASIIGGVTATLANYLLRVLFFLTMDKATFAGMIGDVSPILDPLIGLMASTFYVLLFCALGYLVGCIMQTHRIVMFVLPVLVIGVLFLGIGTTVSTQLVDFYVGETDLLVFVMKTLLTTVVLFAGAFVLMGKKEVRN